MGAMTYMIGTAVAGYFIFFTIFVVKTYDYIPTFFQGMIEGMKNPVNAMMGVPLGFILGMQKIIQTAETGLGALAMAAQESDSKPREAAMIFFNTNSSNNICFYSCNIIHSFLWSRSWNFSIIKY